MRITDTEVSGIKTAMRAMRNPMNSWEKSDSYMMGGEFALGEDDKHLSQKLTNAGAEHCKHLRMITVWADMELPRYLWQEMDTYRHMEKVSCSTIHKLLDRKLTLDDFESEGIEGHLVDSLVEINMLIGDKDPNALKIAKSILPESYLQKRTVCTNYQQLLNIYNQRKGHRLQQWRRICDWILELPYFMELTGVRV